MVSYFHRFYQKLREIVILWQYFVVGKAFFPLTHYKKFF